MALNSLETLPTYPTSEYFPPELGERTTEGRRPCEKTKVFPNSKIALPRHFSSCKPIGIFRPEIDALEPLKLQLVRSKVYGKFIFLIMINNLDNHTGSGEWVGTFPVREAGPVRFLTREHAPQRRFIEQFSACEVIDVGSNRDGLGDNRLR